MNFAMATLGLKEMGKFLWEGREKSLPIWLSQFSFAKLGLEAIPLSLKNQLLRCCLGSLEFVNFLHYL